MGDPVRAASIFYFSGTGNTELLAEQFATELKRCQVATDLGCVETYTQGKMSPAVQDCDLVGIGYPVHAWNAPRIVFEFLRLLPPGEGRRAFLFKSPGDPYLNGGSTLPVRRRLEARGYRVIHEEMLVMPANLAVAYPLGVQQDLYAVACERIRRAVGEMLAGVPHLQHNTWAERLGTLVSAPEHLGTRLLRLLFHVRESCHGCGLCAERCPAGNITMRGDRPAFGWRCLACLRCVYLCPVRAIGLRGLEPVLLKEGYDIRAALAAPRGETGLDSSDLPPLYRRMQEYAREEGGAP